jgi:hypothetical protein
MSPYILLLFTGSKTVGCLPVCALYDQVYADCLAAVPIVSMSAQVGAPTERAQYIHRVGRTGRAGKAGKGVLLLADSERFFLSSLRDLPVQQMAALQPDTLGRAKNAINSALPRVSDDTKASVRYPKIVCCLEGVSIAFRNHQMR